jgi:hypothetical protein
MSDPTPRQLLTHKARAFIGAIQKLPARQKGESVTSQFAEDYNQLRSLTEKEFPTLADYLPPQLAIHEDVYPGVKSCDAKYVEVETYAGQILSMLVSVRAPPPAAEVNDDVWEP